MSTEFKAVIPMRGDLSVIVRRAKTGAVHWRYDIRNTITYLALKDMINLLAQLPTSPDGPESFQIAYLGVGGDASLPPSPATRTDTDLNVPVLPVYGSRYFMDLTGGKTLQVTGPYELQLTATIPTTDLNGDTLREAGLFTKGISSATTPGEYPAASGRYVELFARQIHPPVLKDPAFVIEYDWRIAFTS